MPRKNSKKSKKSRKLIKQKLVKRGGGYRKK